MYVKGHHDGERHKFGKASNKTDDTMMITDSELF